MSEYQGLDHYQGLDKNFQFLVLEVAKQLEDTHTFLKSPEPQRVAQIASRDDYIDHLKSLIENKCYSLLFHANEEEDDKTVTNLLRAIHVIAINLERIGDHCQNIVAQLAYLTHADYIEQFNYSVFFDVILETVEVITDATMYQNLQQALDICRSERELDRLYKGVFDQIQERLKSDAEPGNLLTSLFIFRYLERIGDALQNVGEAILSAAVGERFKFEQFASLEQSLQNTLEANVEEGLRFHSYWNTRSGCRIGRVQAEHATESGQWVMFKEGRKTKISQEHDNINRWEALIPGLPPKIFDYKENKEHALLLVEYLRGKNYQEIILTAPEELYQEAFASLTGTLPVIWKRTLEPTPTPGQFLNQLHQRLRDIFMVHPTFKQGHKRIGSFHVESFEALLDKASAVEAQLPAPFIMQIHGDFNTDNIIYDDEKQKLHFIDVYRSRRADYVQDVSVFLVSNFRLPFFATEIRQRLNRSARDFLYFARNFAASHDDTTFEARLAMGLIRSFATSTRFELNPNFAKAMYMRAQYLLRKMLSFPHEDWGSFQIPDEILKY